ncbi:MAG: carbamoyltransferase [Rhodospirillaceae bacterium]|jgi:carbamoyltransferase|nr:carbamoyltransferase [Rhodospirillaceae bacterium]MDP6644864.1 carbamoyltransferase C-terminal domain-containing protein [Rhodospirillales bacterium]
MIVLGLKCYSHDTGAAIVSDAGGGLRVHAISEARLNRRKHSFTYPLMSIAYCLDSLGLESLSQVDLVCIDRHMETWPEENSQFGYQKALDRYQPRYDDNHRWNYLAEQSIDFSGTALRWVNHVDAHAASAYYASPFDDAAVLIAEGGTGIYRGEGAVLGTIDRIGYLGDSYRDGAKLATRRDHFVNSSFLYDRVSELLGYDIFGAGQTMALAGYAHRFPKRDLFDVDPDRFDDFIINHDRTVHAMLDMETYAGADAGIVDAHWTNLARQAQETLEEDILYLAWLARKKTRAKNLCLAGGAALNCIINRKIMESGLFRDMFIQPAASDEGIPLGAALHGYYASGGTERWHMEHAYLGKAPGGGDCHQLFDKWRLTSEPADPDAVAKLLAGGAIVGRIDGPSEYGPRALGNRSILADPRPADMKDRLNAGIKHREGFRPFAPSCLADAPPEFFDTPHDSPFMIVAGQVAPTHRDQVPAVTHADGSCRVQTVARETNPDYHALIDAFGAETGIPLVLNTSFNDRGEPIVESPEDAISCFLRTGLDALWMDGMLVRKSAATPEVDGETLLAATAEQVARQYTDLIERFCDMAAYVALAGQLTDREKSLSEVG